MPGTRDPNTLEARSQRRPRYRARVPKVVTAVLLVIALAGCGGGSNADSEALSAAEWRREANVLCKDIGGRVRAVPVPRTEHAILAFTSEVIPLWKQEEDRLRALAPPEELEVRAGELADALAEINVALLEIHIATQRNDGIRRFEAVQRSETAARGVKLRSRDLELPACASQRIP